MVYGTEASQAFRTSILEGKGWLDNSEVETEVVDMAVRLLRENPKLTALLLECSDMPP